MRRRGHLGKLNRSEPRTPIRVPPERVGRRLNARDVAADRFLGRIVAICLLWAVVANLAGVTMFMIRDGPGGLAPSWAFFVAERSLFIAAMVLSALGFCLLDGRLSSYVLARLGVLT